MAASSGIGRPIPRGPATVDVPYQDFFPPEANRFDYLRQQLSGSSDKGSCLGVFVRTWRLAHEHQARVRVALGIYNISPTLVERAAGTVLEFGPDLLETFVRRRQRFCGLANITKQGSARVKRREGVWSRRNIRLALGLLKKVRRHACSPQKEFLMV